MADVATRDGQQRQVELAIGGMTCAACATRIEKKLNRMDGVDATVNLATERAHVLVAAGVADSDLIGVVEATGYTHDEYAYVRATTRSTATIPTRPRPSVPTWPCSKPW